MLRKILASFILLSALPFAANAQVSEAGKPIKAVHDADIVGTVIWHSDTIYNLKEGVFVDDGEVLIIEPGTIIKGDTGTQANAKFLCVSRGGKIYAEGSECCPIIFTTIFDNVDDPNDLDISDAGSKGLWGGLVLLGHATINIPGGVDNVEGIPPSLRTEYGGADDDDNSGVVRYVSLRHGGTVLAPNQEINGLTMGGVGRGTRIDHVETFLNADDGYEFFGGTVNCKYLASIFNDDDNYDTDQGYRGSIQYGFIIQSPFWGDRFFEQDGADAAPWTDLPAARPMIANVTAIGSGTAGATGGFIQMRENTAGGHFNEIWTEGHNGTTIQFQSFPMGTHSTLNNYVPDGGVGDPWVGQGPFASALLVQNNITWRFNGGLTATDPVTVLPQFILENDADVNPLLVNIDYTQSALLDPTLQGGSPAVAGGVPNPADPDNWLDDVAFQGGFDPAAPYNWLCYWTFASWGGILAPCDEKPLWSCPYETGKPIKEITDDSIVGTVYFHSDTVYNLKGGVYVDSGEVLIVAPGTVIKSDLGTYQDVQGPTYLVISRGGKGYFNGCDKCPIVMTSILDNIEDPMDLPVDATSKGLWGGLVLLGRAMINIPGGVDNVEGIPPTLRSEYGGNDDNDNSGTYRYLSIRHPSVAIALNQEINGMTFGAVGRGTRVDHIEVYQSADDDMEFFGGTVNVNHVIAVFGDDDTFDTDQGYRGSGQFLIGIKHPDYGDRLTEQDGADAAPWTDLPAARPIWANYTGIGSDTAGAATGGAMQMRENTAGGHYNSLLGYAANSQVYDMQQFPAGTHSSRNNYIVPDGSFGDPWPGQGPFADTLRLRNNRYFRFGGVITAALNSPNINDSIETQLRMQNLVDKSPFYGNVPKGAARTNQTNNWDPRPRVLQWIAKTNPVWTGGIPNPTDPDNVLEDVPYQGALAGNLALDEVWFYNWSFFACGKFYGDNYTPSCCSDMGNVNRIGNLNILDVNFLVSWLFAGGPAPACPLEANVDGVGITNILDVNRLVSYLFASGAPLVDCDHPTFP